MLFKVLQTHISVHLGLPFGFSLLIALHLSSGCVLVKIRAIRTFRCGFCWFFISLFINSVSFMNTKIFLMTTNAISPQHHVGRTSPQRTVQLCSSPHVRPARGLSLQSWPATCWLPTFFWSIFSLLSSSMAYYDPSFDYYVNVSIH